VEEEAMIITRTPVRISLAGGGTDMPSFFMRQFGAVVSFAINKYIYISVNKKFDGKIRLSYSQTENVEQIGELQHDIAREMLKFFDVGGVEITSVADIPGEGSGLGSSSAYAVGLGLALRAYKGWRVNPTPVVYADLAWRVERENCEHPVGMQDHYAAAYGGLHYYQFNTNATVTAELLKLDVEKRQRLEDSLMLFYTGKARSADVILQDQEENIGLGQGAWVAAAHLRDLALRLKDELRQGMVDNVGEYLKEGWEFKKRMSGGISAEWIDKLYDKAIEAGAIGGKLCGAGGGGFMLFAVKQGWQDEVEEALGLPRVPFRIEEMGSCVIYNDGGYHV